MLNSNFFSKFTIIIISLNILILISCSGNEKKVSEKEKFQHKSGQDALQYIKIESEKKQKAIENFCNSLSLEEKISQLFIINLQGNEIFKPIEHTKDIAQNALINQNDMIIPGGYIFFSYNVASEPQQIMNFTDSINEYCRMNNKIPPFLAIDQEGGNVNRLRNITGPLPSQKKVAQNLSETDAGTLYSLQAQQMYLLGFNMNLAPVTEIEDETNALFLDGRTFGAKNEVLSYSANCVDAYQNNGILTVLKHFPGNTNTDPHSGLPEIQYDFDTLMEKTEPFKSLNEKNPAGILMSHARTKALDSENPACLSEKWITDILRNKYSYKGIIFSDDIFMDALAKNGYPPEKAVIKAIDAGINCIMISEKRILSPSRVLYDYAQKNPEFMKKIDNSANVIIQTKIKAGLLKLEDEKNDYKIISGTQNNSSQNIENLMSINEKIAEFNKLKNENLSFYKDKFR